MKLIRWAGVLALATFLTVSDAQGQASFKNFFVCGGNHFDTCASIDLQVFETAGGGTVRMDVWNLSGFGGTYSNTVFTEIGLFNVPGVTSYTGLTNMSGSAYGGSPTWWSVGGSNAGGVERDLQFTGGPGIHSGIASACNDGGLPGVPLWITGCDPDAGRVGNSVVMEFGFSGTWYPSSTELVIHGQNGPEGLSTQCITGEGGNCDVIPEPLTMALLGTGLVGIGGAAWRRRRREDEI